MTLNALEALSSHGTQKPLPLYFYLKCVVAFLPDVHGANIYKICSTGINKAVFDGIPPTSAWQLKASSFMENGEITIDIQGILSIFPSLKQADKCTSQGVIHKGA